MRWVEKKSGSGVEWVLEMTEAERAGGRCGRNIGRLGKCWGTRRGGDAGSKGGGGTDSAGRRDAFRASDRRGSAAEVECSNVKTPTLRLRSEFVTFLIFRPFCRRNYIVCIADFWRF